MTGRRFEWDGTKNKINQRKHGLSFELAVRVFDDPLQISILERIEEGEERWQTYGLVGSFLLILVVHTLMETEEDGSLIEVMRIISARRADRTERRRYESENN